MTWARSAQESFRRRGKELAGKVGQVNLVLGTKRGAAAPAQDVGEGPPAGTLGRAPLQARVRTRSVPVCPVSINVCSLLALCLSHTCVQP